MDTNIKKPAKAAWWLRLLGFIIDTVTVMIPTTLILPYAGDDELLPIIFGSLYIGYCICSEAIFNKTLGKALTGTIVLDSKTFGKPSFGQIAARGFFRLIPFEIFSFLSERPQGWHDSFPDTMVTTSKALSLYKTGQNPKTTNFFLRKIELIRIYHVGVYRIVIALSFIIPCLLSGITAVTSQFSVEEKVILTFISTTIIYWVLILIGLWIFEGFIDQRKRSQI